jgi:pSer/pThr/pTyr-binding forkhead associated (FHA) protein
MNDIPGLILLSLRFLMVISLYVFLGSALWILWRDLRKTDSQQQHIREPISISIIQKEFPAQIHVLTNPIYILGRAASCDIYLDDETVSSQHAKIYFESSNWWVEDIGSSNGTYLNDSYLKQPAVLTDQDILQFGNVKAEIELSAGNRRMLTDDKGFTS